MSGEVRFPGSEVRRHATAVETVADAVREARGAVRGTTMDPGAYGVLCQFLPGLLSPLFDLATVALDRSAGALDSTAAGLRATAGDMDAADGSGAVRLRATRSLPKLPL